MSKKDNIKIKDKITLASTLLGIFVILLTGFVIIYQYAIYIYEMQWFNYWGIDDIFYIKDRIDITNSLINSFFIMALIFLLSSAMYEISINNITKKETFEKNNIFYEKHKKYGMIELWKRLIIIYYCL